MVLKFAFDLNLSKPIYKTLAAQMLDLINTGQLGEGAQLPPTRNLAKQLQVSRDVVIQCYRELTEMGVAEVKSTHGIFVCGRNVPPSNLKSRSTVNHIGAFSKFSDRLPAEDNLYGSSAYLEQLNYGGVPPDSLPSGAWNRLLMANCKTKKNEFYKPDVLGRIELRLALQRYLKRSKGLTCDHNQIVIWSQAQNSLNALCRVLLNPGDNIAVEEPGFGGIKNICQALDINLCPIPVDDQGIRVDLLKSILSPIKLAYVSSTHQDPTGVRLSESRRRGLLDWAGENKAWIIEDDYDGFFSFDNLASTPLAASDADGHVIYTSSFWKVMYPLTTLGFAVVPKAIASTVARCKLLSEPNSASIDQMALAEFLESGKFSRHLRSMQKIYAEQRRALVIHLTKAFGKSILISRQSAGSHQLVRFYLDASEQIIEECGKAAGLGINSTGCYYLQTGQKGEYMIDFSCLPTDRCEKVVKIFKSLLLK